MKKLFLISILVTVVLLPTRFIFADLPQYGPPLKYDHLIVFDQSSLPSGVRMKEYYGDGKLIINDSSVPLIFHPSKDHQENTNSIKLINGKQYEWDQVSHSWIGEKDSTHFGVRNEGIAKGVIYDSELVNGYSDQSFRFGVFEDKATPPIHFKIPAQYGNKEIIIEGDVITVLKISKSVTQSKNEFVPSSSRDIKEIFTWSIVVIFLTAALYLGIRNFKK